MTTTIINTEDAIERFSHNGGFVGGAFVRDGDGVFWLAWDTEDGAMCMRPRNEDEVAPGAQENLAAYSWAEWLPFPLTITTEEAQS